MLSPQCCNGWMAEPAEPGLSQSHCALGALSFSPSKLLMMLIHVNCLSFPPLAPPTHDCQPRCHVTVHVCTHHNYSHVDTSLSLLRKHACHRLPDFLLILLSVLQCNNVHHQSTKRQLPQDRAVRSDCTDFCCLLVAREYILDMPSHANNVEALMPICGIY